MRPIPENRVGRVCAVVMRNTVVFGLLEPKLCKVFQATIAWSACAGHDAAGFNGG
jgi:hypothetical protein